MKPNIGRTLVAVTVFALLVYAVLAVASDVRSLRAVLGQYAWWTFGASLALAFGNYVLRFAKWEYYLRRLRIGATPEAATVEPFEPVPRGESFAIFLAGFAMSITPGKAGEVFRSALLASARGTPVALSAPIVIADRVTDLLALVLLVGVGSAYFAGYAWIGLAALALVSAVFFFVFVPAAAELVFVIASKLGPLAKIVPKLREAYGALRTVLSPSAVIATTLVSIVAWGLECVGLWVILRGLGQPTSLALSFFVYGTATVAGALAMLPGGLGGTELTMRTMLTSLGAMPAAPAAAATLLVRIATLWFAVLVGFIALWVFRQRYDRRVLET
ncbi:MAG: flippase-like domain-containing protein [Myxococcales bacterium]|nr:flippase-like domain-containing protein [Myxococcales bacterium]